MPQLNQSSNRPPLTEVGINNFRWTAQHEAHFTTRRSIANIGVVIGQSTQLLYPAPPAASPILIQSPLTNDYVPAWMASICGWG
jgi:hypothetical protein